MARLALIARAGAGVGEAVAGQPERYDQVTPARDWARALTTGVPTTDEKA
jgi:hypothetical protein